jgi:outer membrane protein assembly factor BamB
MSKWLCLVLLSFACGLAPLFAQTPSGAGGLLVHVGSTDGQYEVEQADGGRMLVHGLAASDVALQAARETIVNRGLYGLASVSRWVEDTPLPYADHSVNRLVVDGAFVAEAEILRVLVPEGTGLVRRDGTLREITKPRPASIDHWGHFDHGADGNPVSRDTEVIPVRQQQWISGVQANPWEGNPAAYRPGAGLRVWGNYVVMDVNDEYDASDSKDRETWRLACRDAFNGLPLWQLPRSSQVAQRRWSLVVDDGRVYAWLDPTGELTALDLATGELLRTYAGTAGPALTDGETICVRAEGKQLVVGLRDHLVCFDASTGAEQWRFSEAGHYVLAPVMDVARNRVWALLAQPGDRRTFAGRWPSSTRAVAVVALALDTGLPVWRNTDVASTALGTNKKGEAVHRGIGQLIPGDEHLIVFNSKSISGGQAPFLAALDLCSGELIHSSDQPFKPSYNRASYNVLWRDGAAWFAGAFTQVWKYDPADGAITEVISHSWNQRCTRFTATPNYFLFGQSAFYKKDFSGEQVCVARSGCALGNIPANGLTYFMPTACGCITQVRGFQAMTGTAPPARVPDKERLRAGPRMRSKLTAASSLPPGPIAAEWTKQWRAGERETTAVRAGEIDLVAVVHQHRLEARKGDSVLWSVMADARISSPPVVVGSWVVFGSHDGYVYGVSLLDGSVHWKFLLAPAQRRIVVNGQLESCWPVYGVARFNRTEIIASAGTHVELAGGVSVASLDAETGFPHWTKHLQKSPSLVAAGGGRKTIIVPHSFINSVPQVEAGAIELGDGDRKGGLFRFFPEESEAELNQRLNTVVKKK